MPSKKEPNQIAIALEKGYLLFYNVIQVIGWSIILIRILLHFWSGGTVDTLWNNVWLLVVFFQNLAVLEVVNVAVGLVRSSVVITGMQVASRVVIVSGAMLAAPPVASSVGVPLALSAWALTESIRYTFYSLSAFNYEAYPLIWARYTLFYVLYPVGVTGELLCLYHAHQYARETGLWSLPMPNALNFAFSYEYMLVIVMLLYVNFPTMYMHMIAQRKKVLGRTPLSRHAKSN